MICCISHLFFFDISHPCQLYFFDDDQLYFSLICLIFLISANYISKERRSTPLQRCFALHPTLNSSVKPIALLPFLLFVCCCAVFLPYLFYISATYISVIFHISVSFLLYFCYVSVIFLSYIWSVKQISLLPLLLSSEMLLLYIALHF